MATNDVLQTVGTQIRFSVSGSLSPADAATNWTIGTPTDVALTLSGVVDALGHQSAKADLGAARAASFEVLATIEFQATPTTGQTVDFYWAPSTIVTAGSGNVAGNSGADAAAPDGALGAITLAEFLLQCQFIGSLVNHNGVVVQNGFVGVFSPSGRFGQLIVVNNSGATLVADNVEHHVVFNPIIDQVQASV